MFDLNQVVLIYTEAEKCHLGCPQWSQVRLPSTIQHGSQAPPLSFIKITKPPPGRLVACLQAFQGGVWQLQAEHSQALPGQGAFPENSIDRRIISNFQGGGSQTHDALDDCRDLGEVKLFSFISSKPWISGACGAGKEKWADC